jgi:diguanylate cyclase (GGDEF)-like protein
LPSVAGAASCCRLVIRALVDDGALVTFVCSAVVEVSSKTGEAIDELTGVATRRTVIEAISEAIEAARREGSPFAVMFCDVDRFKSINDSLGHDVGDQVLRRVADRIRAVCGDLGVTGRMGGDEFAVVLRADEATVAEAAQQVIRDGQVPLRVSGRTILARLSIGYAMGRPSHLTPVDVLRDADTALYDAKARGRDPAEPFSAVHAERLRERARIEQALIGAVERGEFTINYQPIIDFRAGTLVGLEALTRWTHPELGRVAPDVFIPIAEETGQIPLIDRHAVFTACRDLARWRAASDHAPAMVSVNLSGTDFTDPGMVDTVRAAVQTAGLEASNLCIEVTESTTLTSVEGILDALSQLREFGCYLAIDDFGTGYSSLSAVRGLPFEVVKIDRSFVAQIASNQQDSAVVAAVMSLAHALGLHVVAEGVETLDQANALRVLGCAAMQGYLFCPPIPASEVEGLWASEHPAFDISTRKPRIANHRGDPLFLREFMNQMGIPMGRSSCER